MSENIPASDLLEQMPLGRSIVLTLPPGGLSSASYFPTAPAIQRSGLPPLAALLRGILLVLLRLELRSLIVLGYRRNSRLKLHDIVLNRRPVP